MQGRGSLAPALCVALGVLSSTRGALAHDDDEPRRGAETETESESETETESETESESETETETESESESESETVGEGRLPRPHEAGGALVPRDERPGPGLRLARGLLWVPRWTYEAVFALPRLALWAFDRYQVQPYYERYFVSADGSRRFFPGAFFENGFGLNIGLHLVDDDIAGTSMTYGLRASYGGRFRQLYTAKFDSGRAFGRLAIEGFASYQQYPRSRFFGIGNGDEIDGDGVSGVRPVVAGERVDDTAVETRFRHDDLVVRAGVRLRLVRQVALSVASQLRYLSFDDDVDLSGDRRATTDVYAPSAIPGYGTDLYSFYNEIEIAYDSRSNRHFFQTPAQPSRGNLARAFMGYQTGFGDDPSGFARWGVDLQQYVDLYDGDRTLVLRGYLETIVGSYDAVPFVDLVRLGGQTHLRGFRRERFRDRTAATITLEYGYPVARYFSGFLFTDVGRVYRGLSDIDLDDIRIGYGGGLSVHNTESFVARLLLASSLDGGLFINATFTPTFDTRSPTERP